MTTEQRDPPQAAQEPPPAAATEPSLALAEHMMECPVCGNAMPDLKGGKATICRVCGFKDSCCF